MPALHLEQVFSVEQVSQLVMEHSLVQAPPRSLNPSLQVLQLIEEEQTRQLVMPHEGSQDV